MTQVSTAASGTGTSGADRLRIHVVFNNVPYMAGLETGWGFSCLIEGLERTVLFDTGGSGDILLANMQRLGLDAEAVEAVVLSHVHADHTGGLDALLARNPGVTVYLPESFPAAFRQAIGRRGASIETVSGARRLFRNAYTTGEMGGTVREQALIVDTPRGLVVITGCAHPDVADMVERAQAFRGSKTYLLMGGLHLIGSGQAEILALISRLQALGVQQVAPSHCTGDTAIRLLREAWKDDFREGGLGAVIEIMRQ